MSDALDLNLDSDNDLNSEKFDLEPDLNSEKIDQDLNLKKLDQDQIRSRSGSKLGKIRSRLN